MGAGTESVPLVADPRVASGEGARLARRVSRRIAAAHIAAAFVGAVDVFLLLWFVLPVPDEHRISDGTLLAVNSGAAVVLLAACAVVATRWGTRAYDQATGWLVEERPADEREVAAVLRHPPVCAIIDATGWATAAVVFGLLNLAASGDLAMKVACVILMGGVTTTALGYLLSERIMRPITARALTAGPVRSPKGPGVTARLVLAWLLATGVPLAGLLMLGFHVLVEPSDATPAELGRSVVAISAIAVMAGLPATVLVAKSVSEPLTAMRRALRRIEEGDLDARVTVGDGSEVGLVQSGFNAMAAGLAERDRISDLFGRHVGTDVARAALDGRDVRLGGEVREVAVLFVDLIGSTALATRRSPRDVVRLLNEFFGVVVAVVERHGGWVNKFQGDAALAVFGAPTDHPDAAGAALAAARELRRRLHVLPGVDAGIGVSAGPAVAGNVGAENRFEYTVVGDPVNEAARLCELAKRRPERLLASEGTLDRAVDGEGERWARCDAIVLRGRRQATTVATPASA